MVRRSKNWWNVLEVVLKKVDPQGRVSLPRIWRKKVLRKGNEVYVVSLPDRVEILPSGADLDRFVNSAEVEVEEGKYLDYHEFRRQLRRPLFR